MPNKPAGKKYLKVSKKNNIRNVEVKKKIKEIIKKVKETLKEKGASKEVETLLYEASKVLDRAAQKKVIKKNTAARKKSRLFKKLKTAKAAKK